TGPEQMLERARALGQYPARRDVYDRPELAAALAVDPGRVRSIIERAVPRPASPVYPQLSSILQIWLHRALTGQLEPAAALGASAREIRALLDRLELRPPAGRGGAARGSAAAATSPSDGRAPPDDPGAATRAHGGLDDGASGRRDRRSRGARPARVDALGVLPPPRPAHALARSPLHPPRSLPRAAGGRTVLGSGVAYGVVHRRHRDRG